MAQLWKIRLPDGRTLVPGDWTTANPLFSVVEVPTGTWNVLSAFSYGFGGDVPGSVGPRKSNFTDTNLQGEGGKLPENEELVVYNIQVEAYTKYGAGELAVDTYPSPDEPDVSLLNMLRLQRDILVQMRIAAVKSYTAQPLSYFGAGTGVNRYCSPSRTVVSGGDEGSVISNNGMTEVGSERSLASPLYVGPGDVMGVDFMPGPGEVEDLVLDTNGRIELRVFLNGYRRRPVA